MLQLIMALYRPPEEPQTLEYLSSLREATALSLLASFLRPQLP